MKNYRNLTQEELENLKKHSTEEDLIPPNSEIDQIKQQITDLQLALTEIYEGGLTNG